VDRLNDQRIGKGLEVHMTHQGSFKPIHLTCKLSTLASN
jgi:hypothetical protein